MTLENYIQTLSAFLTNNPEARHLEVYSSDVHSTDYIATLMPEPELCHVDVQGEYSNQETINDINDSLLEEDETPLQVNAVVC